MKQDKNIYQKEIRFKELCPYVHNSVEEFLPMSLFFQVSLIFCLSCDSSWNVLWSCISSGSVYSQNTFSISKSRNCSSSLMLKGDCSFKDGSDSWVSDGPGIGRGQDSSSLSLSVSLWNLCCKFSSAALDASG